jgi:putative FmdB family regulatory protein
MPTYEYACRNCNHRFEKWQKMSDQPLTTCPVCGGSIHRVFFPAGIVFKGSGFYKTDHAGSAAAAAAASTNGSGNTETAATEKSETKPSGASGESKPAASTGASTGAATESKAS